MICMKNLWFSSRPRAKVRRQGPPGSARAQPWLMPHGASRNTPLIELIQYGRRIGKKVYCALLEYLKVYPIRSHPQLLSCLLAALKVRILFISLFLCDLTTGYRKVLSRFDRNTVRNSGRRQIFWRDVEFCKLENCEMVHPCIPLD